MFCKDCGSEIPKNARFCSECGAAAELPEETPRSDPQEEEALPSAQESGGEPTGFAPFEAGGEPAPEEPAPPASEPAPPAPEPEPPFISALSEGAPAPEPVKVQQSPAAPVAVPAPAPQFVQRPAPQAAQKAEAAKAFAAPERKDAVGVGIYLLMLLVACLPVVGLVVQIIVMVVTKRQNLKNFCMAMIILNIIGLLLAIAAGILGAIYVDKIFSALRDFFSNYSVEFNWLF